jgi:hypothetical protein
MCIWDVSGGDGILLRCFSLHPYLVDYRNTSGWRPRPRDASAVDASFIVNCLIPWKKIYQVTDSDDFVVLSLTSMHARDYPREPNTNPLDALITSSRRYDITMLHRAYFMSAIKMHVGDLDERWAQLERDTLQIAYTVMPGSDVPVYTLPTLGYPNPSEIIAKANLALAGNDLSGISGKLALRVVLKKLAHRVLGR